MAASISPTRNGTPCILDMRLGVDQVLGPQDPAELAQVDLGHQDLGVAAQDLAQVRRATG